MWQPKLGGGGADLEKPDLKYPRRNSSQNLPPTNYGLGKGGRSYKFLGTRDLCPAGKTRITQCVWAILRGNHDNWGLAQGKSALEITIRSVQAEIRPIFGFGTQDASRPRLGQQAPFEGGNGSKYDSKAAHKLPEWTLSTSWNTKPCQCLSQNCRAPSLVILGHFGAVLGPLWVRFGPPRPRPGRAHGGPPPAGDGDSVRGATEPQRGFSFTGPLWACRRPGGACCLLLLARRASSTHCPNN